MREKWVSFFVLFALAAVAWMPGTAQADITFSAGVGYVGSEPGGTFERIDTYITGGTILFSSADVGGSSATIDYGGCSSFPACAGSLNTFGWTGAWVSDIKSTASGDPVTAMWWDYNFQGSSLEESGLGNPFALDINYYNAGGFFVHEHATFSGGWWSLLEDVLDSNEYFPCGEVCDDSIACTVDTCNEATHSCESTPNDAECDDSNECTDDSCDAEAGCLNVCNATGADDPCCDNPACQGEPICATGSCAASAQASTFGTGPVHDASDLGKHLAYFLLSVGTLIGLTILRRKR